MRQPISHPCRIFFCTFSPVCVHRTSTRNRTALGENISPGSAHCFTLTAAENRVTSQASVLLLSLQVLHLFVIVRFCCVSGKSFLLASGNRDRLSQLKISDAMPTSAHQVASGDRSPSASSSQVRIKQSRPHSPVAASGDIAHAADVKPPAPKRARKAINCEPCRNSKLKCDRWVSPFPLPSSHSSHLVFIHVGVDHVRHASCEVSVWLQAEPKYTSG